MDGYRLVTPEVRDRDPLRPLEHSGRAWLVMQVLHTDKIAGPNPAAGTKNFIASGRV